MVSDEQGGADYITELRITAILSKGKRCVDVMAMRLHSSVKESAFARS